MMFANKYVPSFGITPRNSRNSRDSHTLNYRHNFKGSKVFPLSMDVTTFSRCPVIQGKVMTMTSQLWI